MDLGSERSASVTVSETDNGHVEHVGDNKLLDEGEVEGQKGNSPPGCSTSPQPATKGRGLRKWRRKPRGAGKETSSSLDGNKKRGLMVLPAETKQRSNGSSSSTNATVNVVGNALDFSAVYGDSGFGGGGGSDFATRADSENSEDQNSRSSTAASAPRATHEVLPIIGLAVDENVVRSLSGRNSGISIQPGGQQEKGRTGASKKARGLKIRKENSHSSMESDSRSSNFVFLQGATNSISSNGRQSGRSANYDEEYSDDALNKEARVASSKNEGDSKDVSREDLAPENSWDVKEEKIENHVGSVDQDALVESIRILHSAQEALEREVEKLRDVGKEDPLPSDDSFQPPDSASVDPQGNETSPSNTLEAQMMNLKQNVVHLQSKLEEAQVSLDLKESTLNFGNMMAELEELFKHKIEAEVEYIAISKTIQDLRAAGPMDEIKLMEQEKQQERKAAASKRQSEKLETETKTKTRTVETDDVTTLQNRVWRYASCFTFQSILLLVVVYLFVLKHSSPTIDFVPT